MTRLSELASRLSPSLGPLGRSGNPRVLLDLAGPAVRGLLLKRGKQGGTSTIAANNCAQFDWKYARDKAEIARLYEAAKRGQWNGSSDIDWSIQVDPGDESRLLIPDRLLPLESLPSYRRLAGCGETRLAA